MKSLKFLGNPPLLTHRALTSINYVQAPVGSARSNSDSNKKRVVKLVSIVILTFTVSWLPLQVSNKLAFHLHHSPLYFPLYVAGDSPRELIWVFPFHSDKSFPTGIKLCNF